MAKSKYALKSDQALAEEARDILDAYIGKANELKSRGLVIGFAVTNGLDGSPIRLIRFEVNKSIIRYEETPPAPQPPAPVR